MEAGQIRHAEFDEQQWEREYEKWRDFHSVLFQMTSAAKKKDVDQLFAAWRGILATFGFPPTYEELRIASLEMILDINLDIPWHRHVAFIVSHIKWQRSPEARKIAELAKKEGKPMEQVVVELFSEAKRKIGNP